MNNVHCTSKNPCWTTPDWLYDRLDQEFHFHTDICASLENTKCFWFFSELNSALINDWGANTCFMNPPYGRKIGDFLAKAHEQAKAGALVVCLVPARTDTRWWHDYVMPYEIRFIKGRIKFGGSKINAPFPSAIVVMRPEPLPQTSIKQFLQ